MRIILASGSPRRKELLKKITSSFTVVSSGVDENSLPKNNPKKFAKDAATLKCRKVSEKFPDALVIAADTIVILKDKILGKPANHQEAYEMLKLLSGKTHQVITGLALMKQDEDKVFNDLEVTKVTFKKLNDELIDEYLSKGSFFDKAGSYAIQDVGDKFIKEVDGDYHNVVGLPVKLLANLMSSFFSRYQQVKITGMALPDCFGVAREKERVFFVPETLIGDTVRVQIGRSDKNLDYCQKLLIEEPSKYRVDPVCRHFGVCGGCQIQDLDYKQQLEIKKDYLKETLRRMAGVKLPEKDLSFKSSPQQYYFRNKMEYVFGYDGTVILGLRRRSSVFEKYQHYTIAVEECPIFSKEVNELFPLVWEFNKKHRMKAYNPGQKNGDLKQLIIRESKLNGDQMITIVTRPGDFPLVQELAYEITSAFPKVKSFYWGTSSKDNDAAEFDDLRHLDGEKYIIEQCLGRDFQIYPGGFFQTNTKAAEVLYKEVIKLADLGGKEKVIGLYCGSGVMEILLADHCKQVIGIDSSYHSIENAKENAKLNKISNIFFEAGRVEDIIGSSLIRQADLLVVDPPRAGLSREGLSAICSLSCKRLIYVSCHPATLARDVKALGEHGWKVKKVSGVDMFPQIGHLEAIALLER
jgi:23S rRNA (uracil1939-C5)-methyltransferase